MDINELIDALDEIKIITKRKQKWVCIENEALVTFAEVKRLVV